MILKETEKVILLALRQNDFILAYEFGILSLWFYGEGKGTGFSLIIVIHFIWLRFGGEGVNVIPYYT